MVLHWLDSVSIDEKTMKTSYDYKKKYAEEFYKLRKAFEALNGQAHILRQLAKRMNKEMEEDLQVVIDELDLIKNTEPAFNQNKHE